MKTCTKCGETKELDLFPTGKGADGKLSACKECKKVEYQERYYRRLSENPTLMKRKQMVLDAKTRSKKNNIPFNITVDDVDCPEVCPITKNKIKWSHVGKGPSPDSPSLDKIIPSLGYTKGNVRVVSHKGNGWKNDMTIEDVKSLLEYLS